LPRPGGPVTFLPMNTEKIRARLRGGFRPFAIELSSGRRYVVPHPEFTLVGRRVVVVMGPDESVVTIDPLHIAAIQNLPPKRRRK